MSDLATYYAKQEEQAAKEADNEEQVIKKDNYLKYNIKPRKTQI